MRKKIFDLTGKFYGNYSFGNIYHILFSDEKLLNLKLYLKQDLLKSKVLKKIKNYHIMDVGTGRQSIAFHKLGAKKISHYDISKEHVKRFKKYLKAKSLYKKISSYNKNLVKDKLPKEKFDFIFLNGILQHFSDVSKGLHNCANSLKINRKIWCYFYRSGTFRWFVNSMIRDLIKNIKIDEAFYSSALVHSYGKVSNPTVSEIMDDLFVPHINLFTPYQYKVFMEEIGFKLVKKINIKNFKNIDHKNSHHSGVMVFEKIKETKKIEAIPKKKLLSKANSINQLNKKYYKSHLKIKECINLFDQLKRQLKKNKSKILVWSLILSLHKISNKLYYTGKEFPPDYENLKKSLVVAIKSLKPIK